MCNTNSVKITEQHSHTDVACKADVGTSMWFAHHSHNCNLQENIILF